MIINYLHTGAENAKTARELAEILHCTRRDIAKKIEYERRHGQPICATNDQTHPGYYIAATRQEIEDYCKGLHKRAGEIFKTRRALLKTADKMKTTEA